MWNAPSDRDTDYAVSDELEGRPPPRSWLSGPPKGAVVHLAGRDCRARREAGGTSCASSRLSWITCTECLEGNS